MSGTRHTAAAGARSAARTRSRSCLCGRARLVTSLKPEHSWCFAQVYKPRATASAGPAHLAWQPGTTAQGKGSLNQVYWPALSSKSNRTAPSTVNSWCWSNLLSCFPCPCISVNAVYFNGSNLQGLLCLFKPLPVELGAKDRKSSHYLTVL